MLNILAKAGEAVRAFFNGGAVNRNITQSGDADLSRGTQAPSNARADTTERAINRPARPPIGLADAASRQRIERVQQSLSPSDKQLALGLALSAIDHDSDFKENDYRFEVTIEPAQGEKSPAEKTASTLVSSALAANPELKNKNIQFNIRALPAPEPSADDKNLALAIALSAIEHDLELKNSGQQFAVSIGPSSGTKTEIESVALKIGLSAIDDAPSLKGAGLQIDVRIKPSVVERSDEDNLAIGIALSEVSFEAEQKNRLTAAS